MNQILFKKETSKAYVAFVGIGTLITGTINAIIIKEQDRDINPTTKQGFFHPFLQTFFMFLAEFFLLILFYYLLGFVINFKNEYVIRREEARRLGMIVQSNNLIALFPTLVDLLGSILQFFSLYLMDPSIFVMMRGGVPITSSLFSVIFLKGKLYSHHKLSLISILIGLVSLCASVLLAQNQSYPGLAVIFTLSTLVTTAVQYTIEEKILAKYFIHPLKLVGLEGLWGIALSGITLILTSIIPCSSVSEFCNGGHLENLPQTFEYISGNTYLMVIIIVTLVNSSFFNFFSISVGKYVSPVARTVISFIVSCSVYLFSLLKFGHKFCLFQMVGFFFIFVGNLIYQEIIEVPGLNANTQKNIEKQALLNESLMGEDEED